MEELFGELRHIGGVADRALVIGETGTGKSAAFDMIHAASGRPGRLLVVNCASLTPELADSLLFGAVRGAFTGANADRIGHFQAAHRGTLCLDEVGELPLATQPKLLRVIEDGEVWPVGANEPVKVDVKVIFATHRDLTAGVRAGRFRHDLFQRIKPYTVRIPPLRERSVAHRVALIDHFLARADPRAHLTNEARQALLDHPWPGNVRELAEHLTATVRGRGLRRVEPHHLRLDELSTEVVQPDYSAPIAQLAAAVEAGITRALASFQAWFEQRMTAGGPVPASRSPWPAPAAGDPDAHPPAAATATADPAGDTEVGGQPSSPSASPRRRTRAERWIAHRAAQRGEDMALFERICAQFRAGMRSLTAVARALGKKRTTLHGLLARIEMGVREVRALAQGP